MSTDSKTVKFPTLDHKLKDGANYPEWAEEMEVYLDMYEWETAIDKTKTRDEKIKKTVRAFILHNTEGNAKSLILMQKDPADAWSILKKQYESTGRTNIYSLTNSVLSLQFNDRVTTIDEHIEEFSTRWNRLAAAVSNAKDESSRAGATKAYITCDEIKADRLLGTLPEYYRMVANNIATQTEKLTYTHVSSQLRELIVKKPQKQTTEVPNATAFAVQEKICNYCKNKKGWSGRGHTEAECRTKRREGRRHTWQR